MKQEANWCSFAKGDIHELLQGGRSGLKLQGAGESGVPRDPLSVRAGPNLGTEGFLDMFNRHVTRRNVLNGTRNYRGVRKESHGRL